MKRKAGILCILLGIMMLLGAGVWFSRNELESDRAGSRADSAISQVYQQIATRTQMPPETDESAEPESPADMTVLEIDGYGYIGYITIPRLKLELPVMDQWDEERLKTAPCRYHGSTLTDDLVLAGHNYRKHFGPIRRLVPGDEVTFTDMDGNIIRYQVVQVENVSASAVEETISGEYALTLLTCTYGGSDRIRVRCSRTDEIAI